VHTAIGEHITTYFLP